MSAGPTSSTRVPARRRPPSRSVTVVGPGLAFTDAYATAVFVMGLDGLSWLEAKDGYAALAITADDRVVWTLGHGAVPGSMSASTGVRP